jgi:hypothetical protein
MSNVKIVSTESDLFVEFAGIRIAKRGRPGTAQAGTWISLEPGFVRPFERRSQSDHDGAQRRGNAVSAVTGWGLFVPDTNARIGSHSAGSGYKILVIDPNRRRTAI